MLGKSTAAENKLRFLNQIKVHNNIIWNISILCFRGTALSLTVTIGRLGAVLGNIVFGLLIDKICIVPFALFVFFLICKYYIYIVVYFYTYVQDIL